MKATIKLEDGRTLDVTINDEQLKQFEEQESMTWEKLEKVSGWYIDGDSEVYQIKDCPAFIKNKGVYPTKEHAEAALAEAQLLQLRNWYRDGWKPTISEYCFDVYVYKRNFNLSPYSSYAADGFDFFSFQSEEVAQRFLNEQRELLEVWTKKFSA
jgi:hypothetical protein